MIQIELTHFEQELANALARLRRAANRKEGIQDKKVAGNRNGIDLDVEGAAGELAFCKWINLYPDFDTKCRAGGHDVVLRSGKTVDVKTTSRFDGNLITPKYKSGDGMKSDFYVLVTGESPLFTLVGYATADMLFAKESLCELGWGPTYRVRRENLLDLNDLR